jgi:hypothetical protein
MFGSGLGRFTIPDPLNIIFEKDREEKKEEQQKVLIGYISDGQNWNKYIYVTNNPLRYSDPTGLERYDSSVTAAEQKAISEALRYIAKNGNKQQRDIANAIINSNLTFSVAAASVVGGSGSARVANATVTQNAINTQRLSAEDSLDYVQITIARETITNTNGTINTSGVRGTVVHETNHAWHMAMAISSFSYADIKPDKLYNPTYWQTEYASRDTSGRWAIKSNDQTTINEALNMGIIAPSKGGGYHVSDAGIRSLIAKPTNQGGYNLTEKAQGPTFSYMQNVGMRPVK